MVGRTEAERRGGQKIPRAWDPNLIAAHGPITAAEQQFVADHVVTGRAGRMAVEVGCGTGRFTSWLHHAHGYYVTGLDLSPLNLSLACVRGEGPGLSYVAHDAESGPPPGLPVDGVDLVVGRMTTRYLRDPERLLRQVRDRWLRPGGCLYLQVLARPFKDERQGWITPENLARYMDGWSSRQRMDEGPRAHLVLRTSHR
ncbi:class I SAM-dependent methyltransferase [Streptomyces sp. NPDC001373]|uniref:class I SAM-dependent methyltransferase n=1 Tax=Streptomyces sp. NPDC001373 TaxID=3364565 RepID=UPI0036CE6CFA